ncbi:MAG: MBOAT family protein [Clostridia bacterium]|nr:MBOAT family protein [Clostridia bacterium]
MSILSVPFLAFLLVLAIIYHIAPKKTKPYVILAGNIFFFLQFDYRYSFFLLFSIVTVYAATMLMEKLNAVKAKKAVLSITLILNIGVLFFVKYVPWLLGLADEVLPFDASNFASKIIVPVGISFYTLQICGYMVDVYRGKYAAEKNIFKFASFSSFFPLMLQGPISRYDQLADQLWCQAKREEIYHNFTYGAQLMLWGFLQKLVIADRAAMAANAVFSAESEHHGIAVIFGILCYTIQIYTDFSGCVDISRGAAQLFGINVIENFKQPYFATSIQDFWKRWHIALSSWLRDYVYISLGGNRKGNVRKYINMIIVFFVSGLWHGVGFHYIVWGLLQAFYQIVGALTLKPKKLLCEKLHINRESVIYKNLQRLITFVLVNISWVVFRADELPMAITVLKQAFTFSGGAKLVSVMDFWDIVVLAAAIAVLFFVSYYHNKGYHIRDEISKTALPVRWLIYLLAFYVVLIFGIYGPGFSSASFIYMNF